MKQIRPKQQNLIDQLTVKFSELKENVDKTKQAIADDYLVDAIRAAEQSASAATSLIELLNTIEAGAL